MSLLYNQDQEGGIQIADEYDRRGRVVRSVDYMDEDELDKGIPVKKFIQCRTGTTFFPVIKEWDERKQVDTIFVTGPKGVGKSTWIARYITIFKAMYPDSPVYLFSSKDEDEVVDCLPIQRIPMTEEQLETPYTLEEMTKYGEPTLVVFDDIESYGTKIKKEVGRLRDEVLKNGRSRGIYCIVVNHDPCDYQWTKGINGETDYYVIFPNRTRAVAVYSRLLLNKNQMDKKVWDAITKGPLKKTNFVCLRKVPPTIVSDRWVLADW